MSPGFITMQGHKYSHTCSLWGKFLPVGMICTTTDTISIPMGEMYLHARMFCALAHMSSIPMDAINFYLQECFLHLLIPLQFPCLYIVYSHGCNVGALNLFWASVAKPVLRQLMILLLCTLAHTSSIPMGAINFYVQESFYTHLYYFYSHACVSSITMGALSKLETCFELV